MDASSGLRVYGFGSTRKEKRERMSYTHTQREREHREGERKKQRETQGELLEVDEGGGGCIVNMVERVVYG